MSDPVPAAPATPYVIAVPASWVSLIQAAGHILQTLAHIAWVSILSYAAMKAGQAPATTPPSKPPASQPTVNPGGPQGVLGDTAAKPANSWLLTTIEGGRVARVWGHQAGDSIEWDEADPRNLYLTAP